MNIPNNQVLRQISDFDCDCGDDFKQPFEQTDISQTSGAILPRKLSKVFSILCQKCKLYR